MAKTKKKTALTRRTPMKQTPAWQEMEAKLTNTQTKLREANAEIRRPKVGEALMDFGASQGGTAGISFFKGASGVRTVMGVPVEVGGLIPLVFGAMFKVPTLIHLGGGIMAPYTADYFEELGADLFGGFTEDEE